MTRNESLIPEVLYACHLFWRDIVGIYQYYELICVTDNLVRIKMTFWDEDGEFITTLDFNNDDTLIESLLTEL